MPGLLAIKLTPPCERTVACLGARGLQSQSQARLRSTVTQSPNMRLAAPRNLGRTSPHRGGAVSHCRTGGGSRRHALIEVDNGRVAVQDIGSTNGTFIDNERLDPFRSTLLTHGSVVRFATRSLWVSTDLEDGECHPLPCWRPKMDGKCPCSWGRTPSAGARPATW